MKTLDMSNAHFYVALLRFVGSFLNQTSKMKMEKVFSCLILAKEYFEKTKYKVVNVYEPLFILLFDGTDLNPHRNNVILVNNLNLQNYHYKWCIMNFSSKTTISGRACLIIPSSKVPHNVIVVEDCLLFNIKSSLAIPHFNLLRGVQMNLNTCEDFSPPEAKKVVISFFNHNLVLPVGEMTKVFSNFLKSPRYFREDDVYSICIQYYSDTQTEGILYFKVINIETSESLDYFKTCAVTESTSIFDQTASNYFLPSKEWEVLNSKNISSISTILPLGMEKYYLKIIKWFQPFLLHHINELLPVFIIAGPSGVGKSVTLEAACSRLGIYFMKVDCNNIVSNTTTQIKSNIKNIFKLAKDHSPVLLHLSHAELLSSQIGNDPDQVVDFLSESLSEISNENPVIVVFTCYNLDSLNAQIVNLSLQTLQLENPSEEERKLMICWLGHRYNIRLTESALTYAASEAHSYTLADLSRMLALSCKKRFKNQKFGPLEKDDIKEYQESVKDKSGVGEVEWEDVGGVERLKKEVLGSLLSSKLMKGLERRGLLLHGPPGTGKTLLARAVANQCNRTFIPVKGPELLNMYVGQSEANIRQVFARAREASPSILFFDELDSLAPNRGNKSDSGGVMDRVVSQLLAEMDGLDSNGDIFILAATNRPDLIDPSLLRPGRFDKLLYVGPCEDASSKEKVLKAITRKFRFEEDLHLSDLVPLLPHQVTGANLYALCSTAWMEAAREIINDPEIPKNSPVIVGKRHFEAALKTVKM